MSRLRRNRAIWPAVAACALFAAAAPSANGAELTVPAASEKAATFAGNTCDRDKSCILDGVLNCRSHTPHVAFCRIFLKRRTDVQGVYACSRLIRLSIDHRTHRVRVSGLGRWHC